MIKLMNCCFFPFYAFILLQYIIRMYMFLLSFFMFCMKMMNLFISFNFFLKAEK